MKSISKVENEYDLLEEQNDELAQTLVMQMDYNKSLQLEIQKV